MRELKALSSNTAKVLKKLSKLNELNSFVLVGGSGLALFLNHRFSEDLDFFTCEEFEHKEIIDAINSICSDVRIILSTKNQLDLIIENVKVTFCFQKNELLKNRQNLLNNIYLAKLDTIITLKMLTLFLRAKFRDYYDIYTISLKFGLKYLLDLGLKNIPNFSEKLFQNSLTFIDDIEEDNINSLQPVFKVNIFEIRDYFVEMIKLMVNG